MKNGWDASSISDFLGHHYQQKKTRNEAYSMRAFARDLGLSPSRLSEILNGKEGLSEKVGIEIAKNLKLKARSKEFWVDLVRAQSGRSAVVRQAAQKRLEQFKKSQNIELLQDDQFHLIADWFHGAVLELFALENAPHDVQAIAGRLDITVAQAEAALLRLKNLGFIRLGADGRWIATPELAATSDDVPSAAIRKFHRQILEKGILSVVEDTVEEREVNSVILAVSRERMPEFKRRIQQFFGDFIQDVGEQPKDDLYALSVQFFPIKKRGRK